MLEAGCRLGRCPGELEEWTWGEVLLALKARAQEERERAQTLSVIAWHTALLTAQALAGERVEPVYERYPFWEEEEKAQLRLAHYRALMDQLAAQTAGKEENT